MSENQDILDRLAALEGPRVQVSIDFSDPPLHFVYANGSAVNPDSLEKIPDLVKDLPIYTGEPNELQTWLDDAEGLVNLYRTNPESTIDKKKTNSTLFARQYVGKFVEKQTMLWWHQMSISIGI